MHRLAARVRGRGFGTGIAGAGAGAFRNAAYITTSSDYDGANDYATRGAALTGLADGKQGTVSLWFRMDGGDAAVNGLINNDSNKFLVQRSGSGVITIQCRNAAGTLILNIATSGTYNAGATWRHLLASWDLATAGARHIYITDTSDIAVTTFTDDTIDYLIAGPNFVVGAGDAIGTNKLNGCLSELFFHTSYLDISVEANRRKFISAALKPVSLGADGSTPLGVQPLLYAKNGDPSANTGSGGNFTITGALTAGSTSPSD